MLLALIFPRAQRASTCDISAERNVWLQSALRSFAIVCDYMETFLLAIVFDLRSAIRGRLRSFTIIWKPALNEADENQLTYLEIVELDQDQGKRAIQFSRWIKLIKWEEQDEKRLVRFTLKMGRP